MARGGSYPIEEFLEAITAQLDKTQDALRLKAVNRPLTFALKDFSVDLQVFVEMDSEGRVTMRPSGPNETGASKVKIGFTTITRPMIEENTVSLEMTQAPTLAEVGLAADERRQLEKLGVRNAAQLRKLQRRAGEDTMSRYSGVDLDRIRSALDLSRPRIDEVTGDPPGDPQPVPQPAPQPATDPPRPVEPPRPRIDPGVKRPDPGLAPGGLADRIRQGIKRPPEAPLAPAGKAPRARPGKPVVRVGKGARQIRLRGDNLLDAGIAPRARLDGRELPILAATARSVSFGLPENVAAGALEIELPDGARQAYRLDVDPAGEDRR
ncbi:MAG: hypothetical protein IIC03_05510 [Proteobacteria bacterium]|nr:hypothetical protein [Pseudomonadota bacterium]